MNSISHLRPRASRLGCARCRRADRQSRRLSSAPPQQPSTHSDNNELFLVGPTDLLLLKREEAMVDDADGGRLHSLDEVDHVEAAHTLNEVELVSLRWPRGKAEARTSTRRESGGGEEDSAQGGERRDTGEREEWSLLRPAAADLM